MEPDHGHTNDVSRVFGKPFKAFHRRFLGFRRVAENQVAADAEADIVGYFQGLVDIGEGDFLFHAQQYVGAGAFDAVGNGLAAAAAHQNQLLAVQGLDPDRTLPVQVHRRDAFAKLDQAGFFEGKQIIADIQGIDFETLDQILDFRHDIVQTAGPVPGFYQFITAKCAFERAAPAGHDGHHARVVVVAEHQPAAVRVAVEVDELIHLHGFVIGPGQGIEVLDQWPGQGGDRLAGLFVPVNDALDAGEIAVARKRVHQLDNGFFRLADDGDIGAQSLIDDVGLAGDDHTADHGFGVGAGDLGQAEIDLQ